METVNKRNPIASVIIPIHDRFPLVNETIASVHAQTYRPIELILVDDASDVPFSAKISSTPDFQIKVIRHERNLGPGASRETGRKAATGEYIAKLDSDDLWHPEKLEKQVNFMNRNPNAGMCYCAYIEFTNYPLQGNEPYRKRSNQEFTEFLPAILEERPWDTSACIWTRWAEEKIGPWSTHWAFEDIEYEVRAGCNGIKIIYLPEKLCYYRKDPDQESLSNIDPGFGLIRYSLILPVIFDDLKNCQMLKNKEINDSFKKFLYRFASDSIARVGRRIALRDLDLVRKCESGLIKKLKVRFVELFFIILPKGDIARFDAKFRNFLFD
jgi:glycosyltransferase involved in cell wall biosynthesis